MKIRKGFSLIGVAVTALAGVAVAAGPASASSGGGCGNGSNVSACISASGNYIEPDMYVVSAAGCTDVTFQVIDDTAGRGILALHVGCSAGHRGPYPMPGINGHRYHTVAWMVAGSVPLHPAGSPELTFSN